MLSLDQFLRLMSLPAVVVAFAVAWQISDAVAARPAPAAVASAQKPPDSAGSEAFRPPVRSRDSGKLNHG
jgi:hypothetical protein